MNTKVIISDPGDEVNPIYSDDPVRGKFIWSEDHTQVIFVQSPDGYWLLNRSNSIKHMTGQEYMIQMTDHIGRGHKPTIKND